MPHAHANWFLEELKNQENTPERFCMLVENIISCRWDITEDNKDRIFQKLLEYNGIIQPNTEWITEEITNETPIEETSEETNNEPIALTLKKLTHNSWVNALISWENIPFSYSCTIIYGLNWQWKSGYFRILNELAGGCEICEIKWNIYNDQQDPLNVSIEYTLNWEAKTYDYTDKNLRWISPFNNIKVFDHNYMKHFLNDREIQWNIEPLWLHLFGKTTKVIEEYEQKIWKLIQEKKGQISPIDTIKNIIHNSGLKIMLDKTDITDEDIQRIENTQGLTPKETESLKELREKLIKLNQSNKDDSLELAKNKKWALEKFKTEIESLSKINDYIEKVQNLLQKYSDASIMRDKKKQELTVLQKIPWNETKEWQSFIEAGHKYWEKAKEHEHDTQKKCIYCQQELLKDSLEIITAYSNYLSDTSQTEVEVIKLNLNTTKQEIEQTIIDCDVPDFLIQKEKDTIKTLKETAENLKNKLIASIENNKLEEWLNIIEISSLSDVLTKEITQYDKNIEDFAKNKVENEKSIKDIEEQINNLEDQNTIHTNKEPIKRFFSLNKTLKILEELKFTSFKTTISRKSSEATEKLITQNLIDKFNEILPKIRNDLGHIELRKANTVGGIPHTKLCIKDRPENIDAILSEWEKKAVCLALFFAEIISEWNNIPIIFDDPVTNLDHFIKDWFSKLIWEMSSTNQIIVFTHDIIFAKMIHSALGENDSLCCHYIEKISSWSWKVHKNTTPKMGDSESAFKTACESIESIQDWDNLKEKQKKISFAFNELRKATEYLIEEKLFAKSITRFDDHIKVQNLLEISFNDTIIDRIVNLHGKISEKWDMHWKSDTVLQNSQRSTDFEEYKKEFNEIKEELKEALKNKRKEREEKKKEDKQKVSF